MSTPRLFIDLTVLSLRDYVQEINTAAVLLIIVLMVLLSHVSRGERKCLLYLNNHTFYGSTS